MEGAFELVRIRRFKSGREIDRHLKTEDYDNVPD
jgi:hypothetical protein